MARFAAADRPSSALRTPRQARRGRKSDGLANGAPRMRRAPRCRDLPRAGRLWRSLIYDTNDMYSVTKRIDFCYGHRLLDYEGVCKHPHGHNAVVEIEIQAATLDPRNMVTDFSDIKRVMKAWIDRELDHKMILRADDPLTEVLQDMGEPVFVVDSNPTVERIARLLFDVSREQGLPVTRITVWETPTSWATYSG